MSPSHHDSSGLMPAERDACAIIAYVNKAGEPTHGNLQRTIEAQLAYLEPAGLDAGSLAHYMRRAAEAQSRQPGTQALSGVIVWPDPLSAQEAIAN